MTQKSEAWYWDEIGGVGQKDKQQRHTIQVPIHFMLLPQTIKPKITKDLPPNQDGANDAVTHITNIFHHTANISLSTKSVFKSSTRKCKKRRRKPGSIKIVPHYIAMPCNWLENFRKTLLAMTSVLNMLYLSSYTRGH
jgi:hypothetical protein